MIGCLVSECETVCIIIDANVAHLLASSTLDQDTSPIRDWVENHGIIVYRGKLTKEIIRDARVKRWLLERVRSGQARQVANRLILE